MKGFSFFYRSTWALVVSLLSLNACSKREAQVGTAPVEQPRSIRSSEIPERREFPVNTAVEPCDNFYQYACSLVVDTFQLRSDRTRHIFSFNDSAERLLTKKIAYLDKLATQENLSPRTQQLKDVYLGCMNTSARANEERLLLSDFQDLVDVLKEDEVGGTITKDGVKFLMSSLGALKELNLVEISADANPNDPLRYDILPIPTLLTFADKNLYEREAEKKALQGLYEKFLNLAGVADAKRLSEAVVQLEATLAKAHLSPTEQRKRETEDRNRTYAEFVGLYPDVFAHRAATLPKTSLVRDLYPEAFKALTDAIKTEAPEVLQEFLRIRLIAFQIRESNKDYAKAVLEFKAKYMGGPSEPPPLKEQCANQVMADFGKELDAELLPVLFPNFPKADFLALLNRVRESIIERLQANTWLSDQGREGALRKMKLAGLNAVYPDKEEDWGFLATEQYSADTPLLNQSIRKRVEFEHLVKGFNEGRNPSEWPYGPLTVNASYNPPDNQFTMPQGILQYPFYDPNGPMVANFGAVGVVVGHELGHGLDDQGSKYDETGVKREWMTVEDREEFKKRTQILVNQFGALVPAEINKDYGNLTLGENIADTSGLNFSYHAAFPKGAGSIEDKKAFYLQYARTWCGTMVPGEYEIRLRKDPHAQTETRVNEPLKHQAGFVEAYSCKAGDKMYLDPEKRMQLW